MGFVSKLKNIFYDDVEEEEVVPSKREEKKEEKKEFKFEEPKEEIKIVKNEVIENIKDNDVFSERELFKPAEKTFNFTEFDEEEIVLPSRSNALEVDKRVNTLNKVEMPKLSVNREVNTKPKAFKPSPVISPIYGILDKDYVKDEIKERKVIEETKKQEANINYDSIRKKAYGLNDDVSSIVKDVDSIDKQIEELNNKSTKIEDLINRIDNDNTITVGDMEDVRKREYDDSISEDTLEHDLFNLIDSMYDDKED